MRGSGWSPGRPWSAGRAGAAVLVTLAVTTLLLGAWPGSAGAHTALQQADPAPGDRVGRPPAQVQLRFVKQSVPDPRTRVAVVGPSGVDLAQGPPSVTGLGVSQPVRPARETGVYVVSYTVVSVDGHLTRGGYNFLLTAPSTAPRPTFPAWSWVLLGSVFVGMVVAGSLVLQSRARRSGS